MTQNRDEDPADNFSDKNPDEKYKLTCTRALKHYFMTGIELDGVEARVILLNGTQFRYRKFARKFCLDFELSGFCKFRILLLRI